MRLKTLAAIGAACAALTPLAVMGAAAVVRPLTSVANKVWPAQVGPVVAAPPVLTPQQALATFTMPRGYHLELVASEPLVVDPIKAEFDGDGRLWVIELRGWGVDNQSRNTRDPVNDIAILEDTNNDGVFDKKTLFMEGLVLPRALKVLDKTCALVGEPPNLWKACDTNGDLVSDIKELVTDQFATNLANSTGIEHGGNGLYWAMDNGLRISEQAADLSFRDGRFTMIPGLSRGQWGVTQDDGGRVYRNVNTEPLFVDYLPAQYYTRNTNMPRTRGLYDQVVNPETTRVWPASQHRGFNRGYRADYFRPDGTVLYYQGVSSPFIYRGTALPQELRGQPFVVDGPTNLVHLFRMTNDNGRLSAVDFYPRGEFLNSTDERFRPVELIPSWDGSFLVLDMYRGVSQDGPVQSDYMREYIAQKRLAEGIHYGRIYRVVYDGMRPDNPKPNMGAQTPAQLAAHLSNANGWWRDTAQQLLVQRDDRSVIPALRAVAGGANANARLHALWTLSGMGAVEAADVTRALGDASPDVRAAGVRLSEPWLATDTALQAAVLRRMDDPNWQVRRQLAATLGVLPPAQRLAPLASLLGRYGDDPVTVDVAISSLSGQEPAMLEQVLAQSAPSAEAVTLLTAAVARGRDAVRVQALIDQATDNGRPAAVRAALMDGVAAGLTGNVPGTAVQTTLGGTTPFGLESGRGGGGRDGALALPAPPSAVMTLAQGTSAGARTAQAIVNAVSWPGKPAAPPVPPLTTVEQGRFNAGRGIYQTTCAGCHGAEGEGLQGLGARLAGSAMVGRGADVLTRIMTAGKEGPIGLMPPLGATMTDEQTASVLTYIRRDFGNTAAPIQPAEVREQRQIYASRRTPWTEAELGGGGGRGGGAAAGGRGGGAAPAGGGRGG